MFVPSRVQRITPARAVLAAALALTLTTSPALAVKWTQGCPQPYENVVKAGPGVYTTALFVHPGHEVGFTLKESLVEDTGGFSTEPGGNTVEIRFTPFGGDPITLPPFTVTAVSPSALYFPMPDTRLVLGRVVVGPALFHVSRAEGLVVRAKRPLVLPPATDVYEAVTRAGVDIVGAVDHRRRALWIPVEFYRFGTADPKPGCPAVLAPVIPLALEISLRGEEESFPYARFSSYAKAAMFLGDFFVGTTNLYGIKMKPFPEIGRLRAGAFSLCGVNDAHDLVFYLKLKRSVFFPGSPLAPLLAEGAPVALKLRNISSEVADELRSLEVDSFRTECGGIS